MHDLFSSRYAHCEHFTNELIIELITKPHGNSGTAYKSCMWVCPKVGLNATRPKITNRLETW